MRRIVAALLFTGLALPAAATIATAGDEDFARERRGKPEQNQRKDALEGKAPPALQVSDWQNTDGKALDWAALRGKVVVIDFWGTW